MPYELEIQRSARQFIRRLRQEEQSRVSAAVDGLADDPRPHGCLKMKGYANRWRIRVGRYRIIYSIFDRELVIQVIDVDDRKDAYRE